MTTISVRLKKIDHSRLENQINLSYCNLVHYYLLKRYPDANVSTGIASEAQPMGINIDVQDMAMHIEVQNIIDNAKHQFNIYLEDFFNTAYQAFDKIASNPQAKAAGQICKLNENFSDNKYICKKGVFKIPGPAESFDWRRTFHSSTNKQYVAFWTFCEGPCKEVLMIWEQPFAGAFVEYLTNLMATEYIMDQLDSKAMMKMFVTLFSQGA